MKMRTFLAYTHLVNFLIGIFATSYVLNIFWNYLEAWQITFYIYYLVLGFCGVVIACWITMYGKHIEDYATEIKIEKLESEKVDLSAEIEKLRQVGEEKARALEKEVITLRKEVESLKKWLDTLE